MTPTSVVVLALVLMLAYRRPSPLLMVFSGALAIGCLVIIWSFLRPAIAVLTDTHLLQGRTLGWKAVPRERITQTVYAARLRPVGLNPDDPRPGMLARLKNIGAPALWFLDSKGSALMRFDGRVWDAKTLERLSAQVTPSTIRYEDVTVAHAAQEHPRMIAFTERHPKLKSAALTVLTAVIIVVIVVLNADPEWLGRLTGGH